MPNRTIGFEQAFVFSQMTIGKGFVQVSDLLPIKAVNSVSTSPNFLYCREKVVRSGTVLNFRSVLISGCAFDQRCLSFEFVCPTELHEHKKDNHFPIFVGTDKLR